MDRNSPPEGMPEEVWDRLNLIVKSKTMLIPIRNFINTIGWKDRYDEWDVREYLRKMEDEGYKGDYLRFQYYSIRNLFRAMDLPWKMVRADLPDATPRHMKTTPVLSAKQIRKIIQTVRAEGTDYEIFYTCVSTLYGARRVEMARIKPGDIRKDRILIRTGKGGVQREQFVPKPVRPILQSFKKQKNFTPSVLSLVFNDILEKAGIKKRYRTGWHSIRRALVTEMRKNIRGTPLLEGDVANFMRWAMPPNSHTMLSIYNKEDPVAADRLIFKYVHPFMEWWL